MIETVWNVYKWDGVAFIADGSIPSPNRSVKTPIDSNLSVTKIVGGKKCIEGFETSPIEGTVILIWRMVTNSVVTKLCNYTRNRDRLKIQIKDPSESYDGTLFGDTFETQGLFLKMTPELVEGIEGDTQFYNLQANFEKFDTL